MERKPILIVVVLVAIAIGAFVVHTLYAAGAFTSIDPHGPKPTRVFTGFEGGTEDLVFRPDGESVFVSSANFHDPSKPGHIYLVDVTGEAKPPRDVTPALDFPFQPHGIDLYVGDERTERLFVVNHGVGSGFTPAAGDLGEVAHTVETFTVSPDGLLTHEATYGDEMLLSPNDVVAVGPDAFYFTNDHGTEAGLARTFEDWLRLPLGNVVYFDGETYRVAYDGTRYANGIAASVDRRTIYVAETTGNVLRRFSRDPESGALTMVSTSDAYRGLDNLDVDSEGAVWTAAHPKLLRFVAHADDRSERSPTQVLRYVPLPRGKWDVQEFYLNDGNPVSGGSVAATNGEVVVVGAVFEPRLLVLPRDGR